MKVDISQSNPTVQSLICDTNQLITLDANFFISPDRRNEGVPGEFGQARYQKVWTEPFFSVFSDLAIHEAVLGELLPGTAARAYVEEKLSSHKLRVLYDDSLSPREKAMRNTFEAHIAPNTQYDPARDNKDDRGEVKTLAFLGTKGYIYFASNDRNALRLVDNADKLGTLLDNQVTVKFYEGIYLLRRFDAVSADDIKWLYKYLYAFSKRDRNPEWGDFMTEMGRLYTK